VPDVRLSGLRKEFDSIVAVDDVDLEIERGEFFTLLVGAAWPSTAS
jgi:ABC-type Fe3+/spermidine/putrescine transport system ATPase subunit